MNLPNREVRSQDDLLISRFLKNWVKRKNPPYDGKERLLNAVAREELKQHARIGIFSNWAHLNSDADITFMVFAKATAYSLQTSISIL